MIILTIRMLAYSAIKISANLRLLYSVLNPDTSSDSASARSKGVRLVSASIVVIQENREKGRINAGNKSDIDFICVKSKDKEIIGIGRRINTILTSYEMVWAIARSPPSKEYLELEDQPAARMV